MKIAVIISTYNSEDWLLKVLWGYQHQTFKDFELIIADDGSTEKTKKLIEEFSTKANFKIKHVWQEDDGFQKCRILNKAILQCESEYIIMSDGDCIPRNDFIEVHHTCKEKGHYLSGGYFKLPMNISKLISKEDIANGNCFDIRWLKKNGLKGSFKNNKLTASGLTEKLLNKYTPTKPTWNGHNASGFKADILKVNGFDERMQYGGEDVELGERLVNLGIKPKQIRYSAVTIHLDHARGYVNEETWAINDAIRKKTREQKVTYTKFGIIKE